MRDIQCHLLHFISQTMDDQSTAGTQIHLYCICYRTWTSCIVTVLIRIHSSCILSALYYRSMVSSLYSGVLIEAFSYTLSGSCCLNGRVALYFVLYITHPMAGSCVYGFLSWCLCILDSQWQGSVMPCRSV